MCPALSVNFTGGDFFDLSPSPLHDLIDSERPQFVTCFLDVALDVEKKEAYILSMKPNYIAQGLM